MSEASVNPKINEEEEEGRRIGLESCRGDSQMSDNLLMTDVLDKMDYQFERMDRRQGRTDELILDLIRQLHETTQRQLETESDSLRTVRSFKRDRTDDSMRQINDS